MTATATRGEREHCLEASMNGYVSKPINISPLKGVLAKWRVAAEPPPSKAS
ncbi:MAG: hypothetical protein HRU17_16030 [Polyangiaceae bacterium]|nr:hypothetical protein [Polyangiaceae bacterium]